MRNLILFLTRNYYFILFLFLQSLSLFLVFQNNHFQRAHFLNSSNALTGTIYESYAGVTEYFRLKEENRKLAWENVLLRNQLRESFSNELKHPVFIKDSLHGKQYLYLSAKVVNNSTDTHSATVSSALGSETKSIASLGTGEWEYSGGSFTITFNPGYTGAEDKSQTFSTGGNYLGSITDDPSIPGAITLGMNPK